ncbi:hypothetical protein [Bifidobacterium animalis]|uniref:hypothetical protein n=1 Tax=Bifidobacterium animalis TaxID=28025 RepID=UPI00080CA3BC|nr:hypothetical protein [Bifidobacterium animalis]ANU43362.1 hypothetical protein A4U98_01915 [Bifidobacterium animalis subsp. animalis]MCR1995158.1 hypothetical protein [Bifidobacterium animalis subsp. animalis]QQQ89588.1 hypothetical protein I5Q88_04270 [Bifidobacterium animalis]UQE63975.1 hypothetical protein M2855_03355 [Bifidobacterium animalis]
MAEGIDFELVLRNAVQLPLVRIDRTSFLRTALQKHFPAYVVEQAISESPAAAGIITDELNSIADNSINYETTKVTALSFATGLPGGIAMAGTVPADLTQQMAHILRIMQKLAYLYGWPSLMDEENSTIDDGMVNDLIIFAGIMFGVEGAGHAIHRIAAQVALRVAKKLPQKALTKGIVYPAVKRMALTLGMRMTEQTFAKGVSKVIPIVGGVVSGGLTFATYRPMACRLKKHLSSLPTASVEFYERQRMRTTEDNCDDEEYIEVSVVEED